MIEPNHLYELVAWRVRGYGQFKLGKPGPWRYFDGAERPKVNDPECCDIEPIYVARGVLASSNDQQEAGRD